MSMPLAQTRHFQVAQQLRRNIQFMRPGQALPTLEELKAEFDASQATIDRALQRLRREGLVHRSAGTRRLVVAEVCDPATRRVAIIRPDWPSMVYDQMARAVATAAQGRDWAMDLVYYRNLATLDLARAIGENDAAVLLLTSDPWPAHLLTALRRPQKSVVVLHNPPHMNMPSVRVNDHAVGLMAVEHLAKMGHRRIVMFDNMPPVSSVMDRRAGWREGMAGLGCRDCAPLLLDCRLQPFEEPLDKGYAKLSAWLADGSPDFSAMFCVSDSAAMAALRALREAGRRVPEDVSLVAYAGEAKIGPYLYPPLTAIEVDMKAYGAAVVDMLEERLAEPGAAVRQVAIEPYLTVRQSTAPVTSGRPGAGATRGQAEN